MAESIDELQIEITASSDKASQSIDKLCKNLEKLKTGIASIDTSGFTNSMKTITDSLKGLSNIKISGFSSFAKNINQLGNMDNSKIAQMSTAIKEFGNSVQSLGSINVSDDVAKMSELARSISRLGTSAAGKAVANMPQLASALNSMMAQLQKAPKVSQNLIDMTNALANFARTGSSGGRAATSLGNSVKNMSGKFSGIPATLKRFDSAISKSVGKIKSFKSSILSAFGAVGGIYAVINGIKKSITIASDLTEVQNVVDVTFGDFKDKIESLAAVSIPELGMSELTVKQIASRFQAMGTAMGIARGEMADMSVDLTRLAGDMSSFYNVAQEDVAQSLQSVFTGETKPLRKYGLDLTQATLKEWALKNGIDADMKSMSQMEKTMLRYQYVMANTTAAQGDFIRTADTWANQVRILKEQLKQLAGVLGTAFINALKPLVSALNSALSSIISFAQTVVNALGKIFGWKIKISNSGIASDFDGAASGADDIAGSTGKAAKNVDKMKAGLRAFDELKTIDTSGKDSGSGGGAGSGSAGGAGAGAGDIFQLEETESAFKSKIKDLEGLGEYIGNALKKAMEGINWDGVYEKASEFGSGLAQFLNGLISPELFADLGTTVAGSINTALHALDSFGETFEWDNLGKSLASGLVSFLQGIDWETALSAAKNWGSGLATALNNFISPEAFGTVGETISQALNTAVQFVLDLGQKFDFYNFGASVATGINNFFKTFDFGTLAETLNTWVDGLEDAIKGFLENIDIEDIVEGIKQLLGNIELDTIAVIVGAITFKRAASLTAAKIAEELLLMVGGSITIPNLTITIMSIIPKFSGINSFVDTVLFEIVSLIDQGITDAFKDSKVGTGILQAIGGAIAGAAAGGVAGSWLPGVGTVAGAIVGAITGAIANVKIDGSSILQKIVDTIFNFDTANSLMKDAADRFKTAMSAPWEEGVGVFCKEIGGNIVLGIGEGIVGALSYIVEPVKDLFDFLGKKICEVFGIHSPAKNMNPYGKNILLGLVNGFSDNVSEFDTAISNWWKNNVKPMFTKAKWEEIGKNIKSGFNTKWSEFKTWWNQTEVVNWWSKFKNNFDTDHWKSRIGSIKSAFSIKWSEFKAWWDGTAVTNWTDDFKRKFSTDKIKSMVGSFKDAIKSKWDTFKSWWNNLKLSFPKIKMPHFDITFETKTILGQEFKYPKKFDVKYYASGGFPEAGSFFWAGEKGIPEMLGTVGGKTAVAGGAEITGIKDEIRNTANEEIALLRQQNALLQALLQKDYGITTNDIGKAAQTYSREYMRRTGKPAFSM